jgi:hypothetical protein
MELTNNQIVEINISGIESTDGDLYPDLFYSFSTTFDPLYSTPNKIRAIAGSYLKDVSDEILLYLIHTYSVEANAISICSTVNFEKWRYFASLWVTYRAALNAIYNAEIYLGDTGQKVYKKLGDFSISKDAKKDGSSPADGLIEKLECESMKLSVAVISCKDPLIDCIKSLINNNPLVPQLATKGQSLHRPMFGRTFLRSGSLPQMTGFIRTLDRYQMTNKEPFDWYKVTNREPQ